MPTIYERDPNTGTMVPLVGGMTRAEADARYVMTSGDVMEGALSVPVPHSADDSAPVPTSYVDGTDVGIIVPFASGNIPVGWIYCNGQAISRTTYSRLFGVIGTAFGVGNGSTTFNVPNYLGRTPVGCGSSGYFDAFAEAQGVKTVTLSGSQVPYEVGRFEMHDAANRTMVYTVGGSIISELQPGNYRTGYQNSGASSIGGVNWNLGFGGGAHNNIMWSFTTHFIIKH